MWFIFESIEYKPNLIAKSGATYSAYVLKGEKKGFDKEPNTPYEKKIFDNTATTVIEKGIERPNCSVVQFFQKAVKPGDTVIVKFVRRGTTMWDIASLEKLEYRNDVPTYEPLTEEQASALKSNGIAGSEAYSIATSTTTPPWVK